MKIKISLKGFKIRISLDINYIIKIFNYYKIKLSN